MRYQLGVYIWRELYMEVLICGILRYAIWTAGNFLWLYIAFSFSFLWKKVARGYAHSSLGKSLKLFHRHVKWNVAWFLTLEFLIVLTRFFFQPIRVGKSWREVCRFGLCFFSFLSLPELLSFLCSSYLFHNFGAILVDEGSGEKSK